MLSSAPRSIPAAEQPLDTWDGNLKHLPLATEGPASAPAPPPQPAGTRGGLVCHDCHVVIGSWIGLLRLQNRREPRLVPEKNAVFYICAGCHGAQDKRPGEINGFHGRGDCGHCAATPRRSVFQRICSVSHQGAVLWVSVGGLDRKSTRLNSSHQIISYAVFCLKKKNKK